MAEIFFGKSIKLKPELIATAASLATNMSSTEHEAMEAVSAGSSTHKSDAGHEVTPVVNISILEEANELVMKFEIPQEQCGKDASTPEAKGEATAEAKAQAKAAASRYKQQQYRIRKRKAALQESTEPAELESAVVVGKSSKVAEVEAQSVESDDEQTE